MYSWVTEFSRFQREAKQFDPSIKLKTKDNTLSYIAAWIVYIISFTRTSREKYLKETATAIGNIHYYPREWTVDQVERTLPHEARHTRQARRLGLNIHPMVGLLPMAIIYFLLPIPILFALGRFWMELDADEAKYRYLLKRDGPTNDVIEYVGHNTINRAKALSGSLYVWAVGKNFSLKYYRRMATKVINEYTT